MIPNDPNTAERQSISTTGGATLRMDIGLHEGTVLRPLLETFLRIHVVRPAAPQGTSMRA